LSARFNPEHPQLAYKAQALKDMVLTLLKEAQALEVEVLVAELTLAPGSPQIDIEKGIKLEDAVRQFESSIIRQALLMTGGNQARAARMLGIKPNTLNYKVKLYNL
jgi:DNA-binding NtrC family response regulator